MPVRREQISLLTGIQSSHLHRLIIPDGVLIQFDLLMMSVVTVETCRHEINKYMKSASSWLFPRMCKSYSFLGFRFLVSLCLSWFPCVFLGFPVFFLVSLCLSWFPFVFLGFLVSFLLYLCLQANAEMVPKFPSCYYMLLM